MQDVIDHIDRLAGCIRKRIQCNPRVGIVLGSGLGTIADAVAEAVLIPYKELPGWPVSTVVGHAGQLVAGKLENQPVLIMQGRVHYYEGYAMAEVTLPIRVMQKIGIDILVLTNAAGSINPDYSPGDVMLIVDSLNLIGMFGLNPLVGANLDEIGPRFPDMNRAFDPQLCELARKAACDNNILLREGVYTSLFGPSFESPADGRFLRLIGVDAVSMSTVPEAIVARHGGMRLLGLSGISNKVNLDNNRPAVDHKTVLEVGKALAPKLEAIIRGVLKRLEASSC